MTTVEIGSISSGTLRTEDLLEAFADELERAAREQAPHLGALNPDLMGVVNDARALLDKDPDDWTEEDADTASWLVNEDLFNALNEHAPPYWYFGAHPGDGADFGFWISDDAIRDAIHDGEILAVEDSRNAEHPVIPEYLLHTNDHGNQTLYRVQLEEVWAIV